MRKGSHNPQSRSGNSKYCQGWGFAHHRTWRAFRRWIWRVSGWADVACRNTVHQLPVGLTSLYIRIPKTPRTEHGKNDLHYCQRITASGDCRLRPAGAERSWFGNTIFGWAVRGYVSKRKTRTKSITASLGSWQ